MFVYAISLLVLAGAVQVHSSHYRCSNLTVSMAGGRSGADGRVYGAWPIISNCLDSGSIVYSYGLGTDISFDRHLYEQFKLKVFGFDPTITDMEISRLHFDPQYFSLQRIGLSKSDGQISFYKSLNPTIGSLISTWTRGYDEKPVITCPVETIATSMRRLGHHWIDVIKLDVEGAEFDYFSSVDCIPATQIIIEFHDRLFDEKSREAVYKQLNYQGFSLIHEAPPRKEEVLFYRTMHCNLH
jgi:FkbM family methyltransferase